MAADRGGEESHTLSTLQDMTCSSRGLLERRDGEDGCFIPARLAMLREA